MQTYGITLQVRTFFPDRAERSTPSICDCGHSPQPDGMTTGYGNWTQIAHVRRLANRR